MSWITNIAGKAENLLNQIDQNAANVIEVAKTGGGGGRSEGGGSASLAEVISGDDGERSAGGFRQQVGPPPSNTRTTVSQFDLGQYGVYVDVYVKWRRKISGPNYQV